MQIPIRVSTGQEISFRFSHTDNQINITLDSPSICEARTESNSTSHSAPHTLSDSKTLSKSQNLPTPFTIIPLGEMDLAMINDTARSAAYLCGLLAALRGAAAEQGKGNRNKGAREHFGEKVEKGGSDRDRKYLLDLTDKIEIDRKSVV